MDLINKFVERFAPSHQFIVQNHEVLDNVSLGSGLLSPLRKNYRKSGLAL
jgi:hypothetical protein